MKKINYANLSALACFLLITLTAFIQPLKAQVIDTLAFQDFETVPQAPVWTYSGTPSGFQSGNSAANATPSNSPLGIGGSRAWHVEQQSGGNQLTFANQTITGNYDTIRVNFRLAAFNMTGTSGGPDNLDYVLVAYSINGGTTYINRLRVRGAVNNNCSWPYSAARKAELFYLPASEQVFQPTNSGLQLTDGIGEVELVFPGSITQLSIRITPRSSSSSDDWLVDNLVLTGEKSCSNSTATISAAACDVYTAPSGSTFTSSGQVQDIIPNQAGCDSIITINLSITNSTTDSLNPSTCNSYTAPSGAVFTTSGQYQDTIPNQAGCDSLISINLTVNNDVADTLTETACKSYTVPSGNAIYTTSGTYLDTIPTVAGCDSLLTINLTVNVVDTSVTDSGATLTSNAAGATYQWVDCNQGFAPIPGETNQSFSFQTNGLYAVIVTQNGCTDTSRCIQTTILSNARPLSRETIKIWPNPVTETLQLDFGTLVQNGRTAIYDIQGRRMMQAPVSHLSRQQLPVKTLRPGIYFIELKTDEKVFRFRFRKD